jgi:hypothetical protein
MGDTRNPSALSLEGHNFEEVGTFQPSFGFKDFHQAARPHPLTSGHPRWWPPARWWGEANRAATSAPPSASRIFSILAGAEGEASRGATSAWVGNPFLPPAFEGERHPLAPRRLPSATSGKVDCRCPARVQHSVLRPGDGRAAYGPAMSRSSSRRQPCQRVARHVVRREGGAHVLGWLRRGRGRGLAGAP